MSNAQQVFETVCVRDLIPGQFVNYRGEVLEYRMHATRRGSKLWQLFLYRADMGLPVLWWRFPHDKIERVKP